MGLLCQLLQCRRDDLDGLDRFFANPVVLDERVVTSRRLASRHSGKAH
jgi:hypothetical protein